MNIEEFRPIARRLARALRGRNSAVSWEDLEQEGMISAWQSIEKGETKKGYIVKAMHWDMIRYLVKVREFKHDPAAMGFYTIPVDFAGFDIVEGQFDKDSDIAYHRAEVIKAIAELPRRQREYLYYRFWCDMGNINMVPIFGYNPKATWTNVRPLLVKQLAHLIDMA